MTPHNLAQSNAERSTANSQRRGRAVALIATLLTLAPGAAEIHVAPTGDDSNPGTALAPVATLQTARDLAREVPTGQPRRLVLHDGSYPNARLLLGPEDSGLQIVAAPGARPRLLGGQRLSGWQAEDDGLWSAPLPALPDQQAGPGAAQGTRRWEIRALVVDGDLMPRARYPAEGALEHLTRFDVPWMSSTGGGWQRRPTEDELTTLQYRPDDLGPWLEPENVEITVYHMWDESCVGVASHDPAGQLLRLAPPAGHPPGAFGVRKYVLWNLREGLTRPGQWYHDRLRNRVFYRPRTGEDLSEVEILVPTTSTILELRGRANQPVREVQVRGLEFSCTTVPLRAGGFAANAYPGAIELEHATGCQFVELVVRGVAGHGIKGGRDVADTRVAACEVTQCGAGGVYVGGLRSLIEDNHIHGIGRQYPSAIGIYRGGRDCTVRHNEVHDCTYSAINYGGTGNVIEANLIYDCMKVLHDGAAIYMFAATNCVLRGNLARDIIDTGGYGASAYYLDERSVGCVVEKNVSVRVAWPFHNHMATNNVIRNNLAFVEGDAKLTFPRSTQYTLERNLIHATGKIRIENIDAIDRWHRNLLFSGVGIIEQVKVERYSAREVIAGPPGDTVTADPQLREGSYGQGTWAPDSPAAQLGIEPLDVRNAGRRVPVSRSPK